MKCFVMPAMNGIRETTKGLDKYLQAIPGKHSIESLQHVTGKSYMLLPVICMTFPVQIFPSASHFEPSVNHCGKTSRLQYILETLAELFTARSKFETEEKILVIR
jgi:hypothetical protein